MLINIPFYYSHNINKNVVKYSSAVLQRIIFFYYFDQISDLSSKSKNVNYLNTEQEEIFKEYIHDIFEEKSKLLKDLELKKKDYAPKETTDSNSTNKVVTKLNNTVNTINKGINDTSNKVRQIDKEISHSGEKVLGFLKDTSKTIKVNKTTQTTNINSGNSRMKESFKDTITSDEPTWVWFDHNRGRVSKQHVVGIKSLPVQFEVDNIIFTLEDDFRKKFFLKIKSKLRQFTTKIHKQFGMGPKLSPMGRPADTTTFLNNKLSAIFYSTLDFQNSDIDISTLIDDYEILARLRQLGWKVIMFDDMLNKTIYFLIPYGKIYYYKESISYNELASYFRIKNNNAAEEIYKGLQDLKKDLSKLFTSIA